MTINLISIDPMDFVLIMVNNCNPRTIKLTNNKENIKVSFSFITNKIGMIAADAKKANQSTKFIFLNFKIPKITGTQVINNKPLKTIAKLFLYIP